MNEEESEEKGDLYIKYIDVDFSIKYAVYYFGQYIKSIMKVFIFIT